MSNFKIHGGKSLSGTVHTGYSKNAALPIFVAALMVDEPTLIKKVPKIEEVFRFEEIFVSLGIGWEWQNERDLLITPPKTIDFENVNYEAAAKTRSVVYLIGALAHKYKEFKIPRSGGCKLGTRTIAPHAYALEQLGVSIEAIEGYYKITSQKLIGDYIVMYESGDTATNNAILAAVMAEGKTTFKMASCNYMVQDLCYMLVSMGAKIKGIGTTTLEIEGVEKLHATTYSIMHDPIESMFWIALAATTNSEITVKDCPKEFLELELLKLKKMGLRFTILNERFSSNNHFELFDITIHQSELVALEEKIYARPFPGLNIDNLPYFVPIAAQAKGRTMIFDWCYENRAIYFTELQKLGVNILLADPHRAIIEGKTEFLPNELICPPALRPATMLLCAMLAAEGTSIIRNTYPIDRGHEKLYDRLRSIGADIEEIK